MIGTSFFTIAAIAAVSGFIGLAFVLTAGLMLAWSTLVWLTIQRLTRPPRRTAGYAITRGLPESPDKLMPTQPCLPPKYAAWTLRTADGLDLPVWEITGNKADGPTVIFSHGWGESRWMAWPRILALLSLSSRIICYDLRGHGESPARSRCGLGIPEVSDLLALIEMVDGRHPTQQPELAAEKTWSRCPLVLYGFSLGAGVSIAAASNPRLAGCIAMVIAEAPYRLPQTPAAAVLRSSDTPFRMNTIPAIYLASTLLSGGGFAPITRPGGTFDRLGYAAKLDCPLTVIHGDADLICPPTDGKQIADAVANGRFQPVPGAGHLDLWQPPFASITAGLLADAFDNLGQSIASVGS